jgi:hypothetical protein
MIITLNIKLERNIDTEVIGIIPVFSNVLTEFPWSQDREE